MKRASKQFCSKECASRNRVIPILAKREEMTCEACGGAFTAKPAIASRNPKPRFCSVKCSNKGLQKVLDYVCAGCGETKTADDFYVDRTKPRGRVARCKDCYKSTAKNVHKFKPYRREGTYRRDAAKRGLAYELTREEFMRFWQKPCAYCGDDIQTIGLDRVDNSRGYVIDNVLSCCRRCNGMKSSMSIEEFLDRCRRIAERAALAHSRPVLLPSL